MGDAFYYLVDAVNSGKVELTPEEKNVMNECKNQARRNFAIGCGGGAIAAWLATMRLRNNLPRLGFVIAATAISGVSNSFRCIDSYAERVLSLEGSRIQKQLATIMLNKYGHDPRVLQRFSKHFFREEVFVDASAEKPIFRWRLVNSYEDPSSQSHDSRGEETDMKKNDVKKSTAESNQVNVNAASVMVADEDPFDAMFETPVNVENIPDSNATRTSHQRPTHRGRHHRKHRRHRQEDNTDA